MVRKSLPLLVLAAFVVTIAPGLLVYLALRALGLGIGGAGVLGMLVMMGGVFAFAGWLFGGGRRTRAQLK